MDALSVAASIIGLITFCVDVGNYLAGVKNAPPGAPRDWELKLRYFGMFWSNSTRSCEEIVSKIRNSQRLLRWSKAQRSANANFCEY